MNLNLFDGSMIVQNIIEKTVKGMYLVVRIVKTINYMERNVSHSFLILVVTNEILGLGVSL